MTRREIVIFILALPVFVGGVAIASGVPRSEALTIAGIVAAITGIAVPLGSGLRRWLDRMEVKESSLQRPGGETRFEVSYRVGSARSGRAQYEVTTILDRDVKWFTLYDLKQSPGLRLCKRLGLSHRLAIEDEGFNREIYVERNADVGAVIFASAERREAARAIFRMGFFAIEYRNGRLSALHKGTVPEDTAVSVRPHLLALADPLRL